MQNTLSFVATTQNATQANALAAQLQKQFSNAYSVAVTQHNSYYNVAVTRVYSCYDTAVAQFNNSVQLFCSTVAQCFNTDDVAEDVSCYVLDDEGYAIY